MNLNTAVYKHVHSNQIAPDFQWKFYEMLLVNISLYNVLTIRLLNFSYKIKRIFTQFLYKKNQMQMTKNSYHSL